jgi:hypothetical protein
VFTALYELIPYTKQITFRLYKVNQKKVRFNNNDRMIWAENGVFMPGMTVTYRGLVAILRYGELPIANKPVQYCTQTCISRVPWQYW